jgi:outer membrane biosynthesis protein TonB
MSTNSIQVDHQHSASERKARIAAIIFALFLLVFVLYPFWSYTFPPPGQSGILVSFGENDAGSDASTDDMQNENEVAPNNGEKQEQQSPKIQEAEVEKLTPVKPEANLKTKSKTEEKSPVAISEIAKKVIPAEEKKNEKSQAELNAAEEAQKLEEYEKAKKQFGEFIGKGKTDGSVPGNTGDPSGDPNTDVLDGISKGTGDIGGGLASRGLVFEPTIDENSQKSGKVVVRVCVNENGEVIEAKWTQKGSTTTDSDLVNVAISGSKRYKFSKSPIERQCGTITIEFKLK